MVNAIEIPQGYQLTDIGIFPEGWKVICLNETLDLLTDFEANGSFESVAENVNIYDSENYAWFVRATDLEKNSGLNNVKYVDKKTYDFLKKTKLYGGEVLITKRGEIGKVYFFQMKTDFATVAPNMYLLKLNESVVPFYIFSFFKATIGNRLLIEKNASSTLGALYKDDVKSILIPLPTKSEQIVIATALSDTDALIENLEKHIIKKRNIKKGLLQLLLIPKYNWKVRSIKEIVSTPVTDGPHETPCFLKDGIPFLSVNNLVDNKIDLSELRYISPEDHEIYSRKCKPQKNDILFGKAASVGKVAIVNIDTEFNIWSPIALIRPKEGYEPKYIYYFFQTNAILKQIDFFTNSSSQGNIGMGDIEKLEFSFPPEDEQTEIANILTDMDNEIEDLERKLHKYRMLKQGMMQVLLTGKIRLI